MRARSLPYPCESLRPLVLGAALFECSCGRVGFGAGPDTAMRDVGPSVADAASLDAAVVPLAFGPSFDSVVAQTLVNTGVREFGVAMSPDGLQIVFASYGTSAAEPMGSNLYFARRTRLDALFSGRTLVTDASTDQVEAEPVWAVRGTELYFDRGGDSGIRRCVVSGDACTGTVSVPDLETFGGADVSVGERHLVLGRGGDLYEAVRASTTDPWPVPTRIEELASAEVDGFPSLRGDGLEIFWERSGARSPSIWRAVRPRLDAPFGAPEPVTFAGLSGATGDPDIDESGRTLAFVAFPDGGSAEFDIYLATRTPL